jgi:hypothetical protein
MPLHTAFEALPTFTRKLPDRFQRIEETKTLSCSELRTADSRSSTGWTIHEVVRW